MRFSVQLPHEFGSIPRARRELERLSSCVDAPTLRNTRLLVSELVTNAVRHVPACEGDVIELIVEQRDDGLRVEVCDRGPGFTPARRPGGQDPSAGWGLHIVSTLAARWGVDMGAGSRVWFELECAG